MRTYCLDEAIIFHKTKEAFGGLSNMAGGYPLIVNGIRIYTSEALYQACRFPSNPEVQQQIFAEISPMTAKDISKHYTSLTRDDWMDVRHRVMRWCLRVKLAQHPDSFGQLLASTGEKKIVELSYKDTYWGAKPSSSDSNILEGENVLGRLLMELRGKLGSNEIINGVPSLNIDNFLLMGQQIPVVNGKSGFISTDVQKDLF